MRSVLSIVAVGVAAVSGLAGCGDDSATSASGDGRPTIVVTTNIIGDMVSEVVGDEAEVQVIMPLGSDPHDFAPSARQAEAMEQADLLVLNGAGFEEGMVDVIESAEEAGAPTFAWADHVELLGVAGDGDDPHVWTDPQRMVGAVTAFADRAAQLEGVDAATIESQGTAYVEQLTSLDSEIAGRLGGVPAERRLMVTNHEVFGYFADRYDLEVIGAVVPSLTTDAEASAADLEALAGLIRERGVGTIFAETTRPTQLADALRDEVGDDVEVVELFTESLGEEGSGAETYVSMMRLNAQRIEAALS